MYLRIQLLIAITEIKQRTHEGGTAMIQYNPTRTYVEDLCGLLLNRLIWENNMVNSGPLYSIETL